MSGAGDREAVFPTRQSLGAMKNKLKGAETGHSLLKRKSEALTKRFREITRRIDEAKRKMGRVMQIAAFSLAEVTYAVGGDIGFTIQESAKQARFRVRTRQENVSGVFLPQFESFQTEGNNDFGMTGLGKGGQQVQRCRETYQRAVETLVELASLQVRKIDELGIRKPGRLIRRVIQTAFVILDEVIKVVNRRDINSELDELDREEFYRLKKVKNNKTRDTEAADKATKAKNDARRGSDKENEGEEPGSTDVLGEQEDNDVIF
ncbi:MAG: H(+)-transporting V1 sector ATPase subunit D [Candelina submexicana]|nr:MAG: H(+)-transporting V1 sector ATPase subunit D [Candelina submexicana]